jgi:hypothetical protein
MQITFPGSPCNHTLVLLFKVVGLKSSLAIGEQVEYFTEELDTWIWASIGRNPWMGKVIPL